MKALKVFRIFGIDIKLHYSWYFIFILLVWSLASSFFPHYFPNYSPRTYWLMGILAALLLFISVLLHELSHSLVARMKKINVESITLFFFGGVAGIESEDLKPSSEFLMAVAGPLFSLVLAGIFYLIYIFDGNGVITAITFYLWQLNLILALFNLVPGFPLDGGRAFRAILNAYYKDLKKATRIAAAVGKIFAGILVFLGVLGMFTTTGGGLWFVLIGGFLYFIAGVSYSQVVIKDILDKVKVKTLMRKNIKVLNGEMRFKEFVNKLANVEDNIFLVDGKLLNAALVQSVDGNVKLNQLAVPIKNLKVIGSNDTAYKAFKLSGESGGAVPVVERGKIIGIVTEGVLMNRLAWELKFSGHKGLHQHKKIKH
ncbi:MAG TPA: site-2 protease family protein [Candidatus Nanoarchaeia archaeon]|nr:site-2 protease family protein [Candidatus Nanoarchaeia archaeon]